MNDSFYAEASNGNRHRRATFPELFALFHPSGSATSATDKEPVGHWYEAQLVHYGLVPSKSKAVAKTRLLDAVNKGSLNVPVRVQKIEDELKKEWLKRDRASKKGTQNPKTSAPKVAAKGKSDEIDGRKPAPKGKRKRQEKEGVIADGCNINLSINFGTSGLSGTEGVFVAKRPKQTARRGTSSVGRKKAEKDPPNTSTTPNQATSYSRPARGGFSARGRGPTATGRPRGGGSTRGKRKTTDGPTAATPSSTHRPPQMARRSRAFLSRRGSGTSRLSQNEYVNRFQTDIEEAYATPSNFKEEASTSGDLKEEDSMSDDFPRYSDKVSSPLLTYP